MINGGSPSPFQSIAYSKVIGGPAVLLRTITTSSGGII
jgi:hypothetical protein